MSSSDPFAADIYYHDSCYIKYTNSPPGKSGKNHNHKENESK